MEKIGDHIYVETEFVGCNPAFVVTSAGIVMIDTPQKPEEAFRWRKQIQRYGEIIYIINTDHHQDHALGNYYFSGDLVMHEGTKKKIDAPDRIEKCKEWIRRMDPQSGSIIDPYFTKPPRFTYTDRMRICLGEDLFELIHVTSHTEDETLVYLPSQKVLFTGDTVCTNGIPSLFQSYPLEWLNALSLIETLDFDVLVPGHGKIGNRESVREFEGKLRALIQRTQERIDRGVPKEAIVREMRYEDAVHAKYPPAFSEYFDHHMNENIERLYDYLTRKS
jgi:cyclase